MLRQIFKAIALIAILVFAGTTLAQNSYPEPQDNYINDFANVINPDTEIEIRSLLANLETQNAVEMTVVTLNSIQDYDTGDTNSSDFATNLFNTWEVGSVEKQNGVLLFVAVADRKVEIKVGSVYENTLNNSLQNIINSNILPQFRRGDYNAGVYDGTRFIIGELTGNTPAPSATLPQKSFLDSLDPFTIIIIAVFGLSIITWIVRIMRGGFAGFGSPGNAYADSGQTSYSSYSSTDDDRWSSASSSSWSSSSDSSSSSSDFGGGSSSGDGASGEW